MTPSAASRSTSATMSSRGRLISGPRTAGTMQKAQLLSQPIWIVTHAALRQNPVVMGLIRALADGMRRDAARLAG